MAHAAVFFTADALLLATLAERRRRQAIFTTTAVLCCVATAAMIGGSVAAPSRLGHPMWMQTEPISVGRMGSRLFVDPVTASYIRSLQQYARANHLSMATPVIDTSSTGCGIVFALGGTIPIAPWVVLNTPVGMKSARAAFGLVPREILARAWIITHWPASNEEIEFIRALGLGFPKDYIGVGSARRTDLSWSQSLWKPRPKDKSR
jgi:hypothetical protein